MPWKANYIVFKYFQVFYILLYKCSLDQSERLLDDPPLHTHIHIHTPECDQIGLNVTKWDPLPMYFNKIILAMKKRAHEKFAMG